MPVGSEEEDLVFLSPDESPTKREEDQGASPQLRRSNRKRKSVLVVQDMQKASGTKKKKCSPSKQNPESNMPKTSRTPPKTNNEKDKGTDVAALLAAMEARLSTKLDANKKAVNEAVKLSKLNSDALDALEEKVDATDEILNETLARVEAQEERVLVRMEQQVKEMVKEQLKAAGFDSQLSAGDLSTIGREENESGSRTYASATAGGSGIPTQQTKTQRQEAKFWECRRSLRLWPVPSTDGLHAGLKDFLKNKLALDDSFIEQLSKINSIILVLLRRNKSTDHKTQFYGTNSVVSRCKLNE